MSGAAFFGPRAALTAEPLFHYRVRHEATSSLLRLYLSVRDPSHGPQG
jgi:hypothetical protein